MNKKILVIVIAVAVLIGGAFTYVGLNNSATRAGSSSSEGSGSTNGGGSGTSPGDSITDDASGDTYDGGEYLDYSEEAVAAATGTKVLFFHAPWCPQCRALESDIIDRGVPAGMTIFKADYDSSIELKQRYEVTYQTTIVFIDDDGELIKREIVYDEPTLATVLSIAP